MLDRAKLKRLEEQYGRKAAHLMLMAEFPQCAQYVPTLMPLSHEVVSHHLNTHCDTWPDLWRQFQAIQAQNQNILSPAASSVLSELRTLIINTFKEHPLDSEALLQFIERMKTEGMTIAVRSTGEEDSAEIGNPGGNESKVAVAPDVRAISKAMRKRSRSNTVFGGDVYQPRRDPY
jgi:hypothetical protein